MSDMREGMIPAGAVIDFDGEELASRFLKFMRDQGRLPASERPNVEIACATLANIAADYFADILGGYASRVTGH